MYFEKIRKMLAEQFDVDEDIITRDTVFSEDLGADSVDIVELAMALEDEFGLEELADEDVSGITTVGDRVDLVQAKLDA